MQRQGKGIINLFHILQINFGDFSVSVLCCYRAVCLYGNICHVHVHSHVHRYHYHRGNLSKGNGEETWEPEPVILPKNSHPTELRKNQLHRGQRLFTSSFWWTCFYVLVLFCCRCSFPRMAAQAGRKDTHASGSGHQHCDTSYRIPLTPHPGCPYLHPWYRQARCTF